MIKQAQIAGFTLAEIVELFGLWERHELSDERIVTRLLEKQHSIAQRIAELEQIQCYIVDKIQFYQRATPTINASEGEMS